MQRLQAIDTTMIERGGEISAPLQLVRRSIFALQEDIRNLSHTAHNKLPNVDVVVR